MPHSRTTSILAACWLAVLLAPALAQSALWEETFPPDTYEVGSAITDGGTPWVNTQGTQDPVVVEINGNRGAELSESRNGVAVRDIPDAFAATGGNDVYIGATVRFLQPPQDAVVLQFNRTGPLGLVWARNVGNQVQLGVTTASEDPEAVVWAPFRHKRIDYNQPTRIVVGILSDTGQWRARLWIGPTSSMAEQDAIAQDTSLRLASEVALVQGPGSGTVVLDNIAVSTNFETARVLALRNPILISNRSLYSHPAAQTLFNALVGEYDARVSSGNNDVITGALWTVDASGGSLDRVRRIAFYVESDTPSEGVFDGVPVNFLRAPTIGDTLLAEVLDPFDPGSEGSSGPRTTTFNVQPPINDGNPTRLYVLMDIEEAPAEASYTFTLTGLQTGDNLAYNGVPQLGTNLRVHAGGGTDVVLNEIKATPPGGASSAQYIEVRGPADQPLTNVFVYGIVSDASEGYRRGVVDFMIDLTDYTLGSNGLLLLVPGANPYSVGSGTTVASDSALVIGEGARTFWLVLAAERPRMNADDTSGIVWLDTTNDGTTNQLPLTITVLDRVGWSNGNAGDLVYGPDLRTAHGMSAAPDAAVRFASNTEPSAAQAWYAGQLEGDPIDSDFAESDRSSNFPSNGAPSPGRVNGVGGSGSGGGGSSGSDGGGCAAGVAGSAVAWHGLLLVLVSVGALALGRARRRWAVTSRPA